MNKKLFEADEKPPVLVTQQLRTIQAKINTIVEQFGTKLSELNRALMAKMNTFTAGMGAMATGQEELAKKVDTLQKDFGAKAEEVLRLRDALAELEKHGRAEDRADITRLGRMADDLHAQLQAKSEEVKALADELGGATSAGGADVEELLNHIDGLETYAADLHQKYEALRTKYKELYDRAKGVTQMSHTTHYGKFDLREHLERAVKKSPKKKTYGDW